MNTSVFDFNDKLTPQQFLVQYGRQMAAQRRAGEGIGGWVHKQLQQFNDPKRGMAAGLQAFAYMQKMVDDFVASADFKAIDGVKKADYKLTGNGPLANAVKRITTAMKYGADLVNADAGEAYCPTMSQCRKFSEEAKKKESSELTAQKLREIITQDVIDEGKLVPGTEAFKEEVDRRVADQLSITLGSSRKDEPEAEKDLLSQLADDFESALRQYAEVMTEEEAIATGEAKVRQIKEAVAKILGNAAARSGLNNAA